MKAGYKIFNHMTGINTESQILCFNFITLNVVMNTIHVESSSNAIGQWKIKQLK